MQTTRIYVVLSGDTHRLVEAGTAAQAIRYCVRNLYSAKAVTPKELAGLMRSGLHVEVAGTETAGAPETESTGLVADEKNQ